MQAGKMAGRTGEDTCACTHPAERLLRFSSRDATDLTRSSYVYAGDCAKARSVDRDQDEDLAARFHGHFGALKARLVTDCPMPDSPRACALLAAAVLKKASPNSRKRMHDAMERERAIFAEALQFVELSEAFEADDEQQNGGSRNVVGSPVRGRSCTSQLSHLSE